MNVAAHTAHVSGWTLFTYEMKIGRKVRTCQRWQPSIEAARGDAVKIATDWAGARRFEILSVSPVAA